MNPRRAIPTPLPLLAIGFGILASCAPTSQTNRAQVSSRGSDNSLAGTVCQDVNQLRSQMGLPVLKRHSGLDKLAQNHAEYLLKHRGTFSLHGKNVSHYDAESRALLAINRLDMVSYSEHVAWCVAQPSDNAASRAMITMWRNSPDHRDAMLNKDWTHTGVGLVKDADGSVFATQVFGTKSMSQMAMRDRMNQF